MAYNLSSERAARYDRNVSKNWKPVAGLEARKPGMAFSDRLFHWLLALVGLATIAAGVGLLWLTRLAKVGSLVIAFGLVLLFVSGPSQGQRNGYRS